MWWLFLVLAILSLLFPPLAILLLALVVMGVFAKGIQADEADELFLAPRRRGRSGSRWQPAEPEADAEPPQPPGPIIDVRSYPLPLSEPLPAPRDGLHRKSNGA